MRGLFLELLITISSLASGTGETAILILARGGSKGVRLKNLQTVGGVTLLTRGIHLAKLTGIEDVTVSTDNPAIALEAIRSGAAVFRRSKVTASDEAPSIWGAAEFLYSRTEIHILALIQTTSPFTRASYLRAALEKIRRPRAFDCVFSVTRSHKLRWKEINGTLSAINFDVTSRPRRQDWSGELLETGAFYIARRQLIETGHFQNDKLVIRNSAILGAIFQDPNSNSNRNRSDRKAHTLYYTPQLGKDAVSDRKSIKLQDLSMISSDKNTTLMART